MIATRGGGVLYILEFGGFDHEVPSSMTYDGGDPLPDRDGGAVGKGSFRWACLGWRTLEWLGFSLLVDFIE